MAKRYSGNVTVTCSIDEKAAERGVDQHKCVVSAGGKTKTIYVGVRLVHGSGVGFDDSPKAYDDSASAAISFAADEGLDVDGAEHTGSGWAIHRSPPKGPARGTGVRDFVDFQKDVAKQLVSRYGMSLYDATMAAQNSGEMLGWFRSMSSAKDAAAKIATKGPKFTLTHIPLDSGGYAKGNGQYYGVGAKVFTLEDESGDVVRNVRPGSGDAFRAFDRKAAKGYVRAKFPGARF